MVEPPSKAVILAGARGVRRLDILESTPGPLIETPQGQAILDRQINAFRTADIEDIVCIAGYHIEKLIDVHSDIDYHYDPEWQKGSHMSGLGRQPSVLDGGSGTIVATGESLFDQQAIDLLCRTDSDVSIGVAEFPTDEAAREAKRTLGHEKLLGMTDRVPGLVSDGELPAARFLGLMHVSGDATGELSRALSELFSGTPDDADSSLPALVSKLARKGVDVEAVNLNEVAEQFDQSHALARFLLGTKAETLERLSGRLTKSRILEHVVFDVASWEENPEKHLAAIGKLPTKGPVVVRSSAVAEDGWHASQAGAFHTELGVSPTDETALRDAIGKVVESLREGSGVDDGDQVLVQPQVESVAMSGVAFTRELDSGGPYTVINYDEVSSRTDTVTAGQGTHQRTAYFYQGVQQTPENQLGVHLESVRESVQELREFFHDPPLDIEFAVSEGGDVIILQVRPLAVHTSGDRYDTQDVANEVETVTQTVAELNEPRPALLGEGTALGVMPDWNPAEMIGTNPDPLAVSLYKYLITDDVWALARAESGYRDVRPAPLLVELGGKPYIDTLVDFNSFLPSSLPDELGEKLVSHYVDRLRASPELQDKVEFEVAFTCLDFAYDDRVSQLVDAGFTEEEIAVLRDHLRTLTDEIVNGDVAPLSKQLERLRELDRRRLAYLRMEPDSWSTVVRCVRGLLEDTRRFGTLPFSIVARYAFIGTAFLNSMVTCGTLTESEYETVTKGMPTIAHQLATDMQQLRQGEIDPAFFFGKYGHLRPGTYDVTSPRYDEDPEGYFSLDGISYDSLELDRQRRSLVDQWEPNVSEEAQEIFESVSEELQELIDENGFTFTSEDLFDFITRSIPLRELAKFEFTRSLSAALTLLRRHAEAEFGMSSDELSAIEIGQILSPVTQNQSPVLDREFERSINHNLKRGAIQDRIQLPPLIRSASDVHTFEVTSERPNYITNNGVTAPVVNLDVNEHAPDDMLDGCIVMIPSADPGYDWIFGSDIAGLVTKFGGVASHMAIRAAEFGLPAAIGAGEVLYENIAQTDVAELNCESGTLRKVR